MRCPDCNMFVSFDSDVEPEVNDISIDGTTVRADVRITNNCADCGTELTEATFYCEAEIELPEGWRDADAECEHCKGTGKDRGPDGDPDVCCECEGTGTLSAHDTSLFEVEEDGTERTERFTPAKSPRYQKRFYGFTLDYTVTHPSFPNWSVSGQFNEEVQASGMESLV